jgi:4-hydroxythreonine-4-phosphate dehydrogenase
LRVLITMGDPGGVGPELCARLLSGLPPAPDVGLAVVGARSVLGPVQGEVIDLDNVPPEARGVHAPTAAGGRASIEYIEWAVREAMAGRADAVVTCPISKEAIGAAGSPHAGHTEMLGALTGSARPVMLLVRGSLRVAFVTTHAALRDVPERLTSDGIVLTASTLAGALRTDFGVADPRLAVCALNPHAGDGGRFGDEEARIIRPAVETLRQEGIEASGPHPSDTLFERALAGAWDGVIAMYHDQGMIPIKLGGLGEVVNVTLGLPIVRTSPGHGTAYDIAGTGAADAASLLAAV